MVSLADYRQRHAQYKRDPDLQDLHARLPVDRHLGRPRGHQRPVGRRRARTTHGPARATTTPRRARAHRAYDEWMPVRMDGTAGLGDGDRLFRRLRFGRLAEMSMLDLRTYRSQQVSTPPTRRRARTARSATRPAPSPATSSCEWLKDSLRRTATAQWKVIGNPVMIAPVNFAPLPDDLLDPINDVTGLLPEDGAPYNVDQWDGYTADRTRGLRATSATTRSRTRCSSPATSTPAGPPSCRTTPRRTRAGRLGGRRVRLLVGDVEQPQGHHRHAAAHDQRRGRGGDHGQQPAHQVPQLRRPRLLGARPDRRSARRWTGSSSATAPTATPTITWTTVVRHQGRHQQAWSTVDRPVGG